MTPQHVKQVLTVAIAVLLSITAVEADGKVTGKITLDGVPLATGKISFHRKDGQFVGASVKDGEYLVDQLRPGKHLDPEFVEMSRLQRKLLENQERLRGKNAWQ